jgi:hypothetical protein
LQGVAASIDVQTDPTRQFLADDDEADQDAQREDDRANEIMQQQEVVGDPVESSQVLEGCAADQCPWCGFRDHTRKLVNHCPQHDNYRGTKHEKGAKVSPEWVPGNRQSHSRRARPPLTPHSVRSAPTHPDFKPPNNVWIEGTGALANHVPPKCLVGSKTSPKAKHGWTIDTPPITFFNFFHKVG